MIDWLKKIFLKPTPPPPLPVAEPPTVIFLRNGRKALVDEAGNFLGFVD